MVSKKKYIKMLKEVSCRSEEAVRNVLDAIPIVLKEIGTEGEDVNICDGIRFMSVCLPPRKRTIFGNKQIDLPERPYFRARISKPFLDELRALVSDSDSN